MGGNVKKRAGTSLFHQRDGSRNPPFNVEYLPWNMQD